MTELSPAAQAVLDAAYSKAATVERGIAAALRAAADQVVPRETVTSLMRSFDLERLAQRQHTRVQLLAIAAELEG